MNIETAVNSVNSANFLGEFTFAMNKFDPTRGTQVELADGVILLGNTGIFLQLKQRSDDKSAWTQADHDTWFEEKVKTRGTKQIRDTYHYLETEPSIIIQNVRGHRIDVKNQRSIKRRFAIVCYRPRPGAATKHYVKHHVSRSAGFIHILNEEDYHFVVSTLVTFTELVGYLEAREHLALTWPKEFHECSEKSLLAHYLISPNENPPSEDFAARLDDVDLRTETWDVRHLLNNFHLTIDDSSALSTEYFKILESLAGLHRSQLQEFRQRFDLALLYAKEKRDVKPWAFALPGESKCFAISAEITDERSLSDMGTMFGYMLKYITRSNVSISVTIIYRNDGYYDLSWIYIESKWEHDDEMEFGVREYPIFRDLKIEHRNRYGLIQK